MTLRSESDQPADTTAPVFPKKLRWRALWPGALAAALALIGIPFAMTTYHPIYHFVRNLPLRSFYTSANQFPSHSIVILLLAAIAILQPRRRPTIMYFLVTMLLATVCGTMIKSATMRARPQYSVHLGPEQTAWIAQYRQAHPAAVMRAERADQWLMLSPERPLFKDGYSSFPSGHARSCFVLAAYLSALYPQAGVLWYIAAAGTGMARVAKLRHWPEDVLFGGAMGWLLAKIVFSWRWPGRLGSWALGDDRQRPGWMRKKKPRGE